MSLFNIVSLGLALVACGDKTTDTSGGMDDEATDDTVEPSVEDIDATPEELGKALYESNCLGCHGSDALGASGPGIQVESDESFYNAIQNGDGAMPAFPDLTDTDIANIILYVRTL